MPKGWLDQSERGSLFAMQALAWLTLKLGRRFGRIFLLPICAYFIIFSSSARRSSYNYLCRVLPYKPGWKDVLWHYHTFASTIHDRIYLLSGQHHYFDIRIHGYDLVAPLLRQQGCIMLGSHLGSFEVLRALGMFDQDLPVNVLMHDAHADKLNSVLRKLNPSIQAGVITLGEPDTLLKVQECIERGEIVGILGDRTFKSTKNVECDFLGGKITLPEGPLALAAVLKAPVILFFGLYQGGKRYDLHFEIFTTDPIVDRTQRKQRVSAWAQRYADRLEHYCRLAPYNWFNFFDYWK
ncbi:lipid A biosynthesis lauroyl acyltransferase [compost metagenome]